MKRQDSIPYYQHHAVRFAESALGDKNPSDLLPFVEELGPNSRVLDLGCGTGIDLVYIRRAGHTGMGMEGSKAMAEIARAQTGGAEVMEKNFLFFDPKEGEWDGIWANESLHFFMPEVVQRVLASCFKGLRAGGVMGLVVFEGTESFTDREGDLLGPERFVHPFTEKSICSMLEQTGFRIGRVGRKPMVGEIPARMLIIAKKI